VTHSDDARNELHTLFIRSAAFLTFSVDLAVPRVLVHSVLRPGKNSMFGLTVKKQAWPAHNN
jgi:hypothetical protein